MLMVSGVPAPDIGELAHRLLDPIRNNEAVSTGGVRKDKEKFVAAEAAKEVVRAQTKGDRRDDVAEGPVAGRMSGVIVDGFEVVDVDEGDGKALAAAASTLPSASSFCSIPRRLRTPGENPSRLVFDEREGHRKA